MLDLSIIIISYNTRDLTLGCVEAIAKEGSRLTYEIIVIDNKSTDGSVVALRGIWRKDKNFVLIENKENLGFAKAVNQGIENAKGEYVLLLNSDTKVVKGALGKLVDFARKTPDAGVVGARLLNKDKSVQPSCYNFPTIINAIKEYWLGIVGAYSKFAPKGKSAAMVEAVVGAVFLITPQALEKVGLFDERYFMYLEDLDYCRRVWKSGLRVYYFPKAEVVHYHGESGKHLADEANQWRRLIPSSKIYHGLLKHYIINFVLWSGQKIRKVR